MLKIVIDVHLMRPPLIRINDGHISVRNDLLEGVSLVEFFYRKELPREFAD
jgi:hypothetical protein